PHSRISTTRAPPPLAPPLAHQHHPLRVPEPHQPPQNYTPQHSGSFVSYGPYDDRGREPHGTASSASTWRQGWPRSECSERKSGWAARWSGPSTTLPTWKWRPKSTRATRLTH